VRTAFGGGGPRDAHSAGAAASTRRGATRRRAVGGSTRVEGAANASLLSLERRNAREPQRRAVTTGLRPETTWVRLHGDEPKRRDVGGLRSVRG
jgi:hypothetical protein